MRSGPKTLAVYAAIIVAGLVAGYGLHALLAPTGTPLEGQGIATVTLQVYKNGRLVYEKKGDPALENLLALLGELLDKDDGTLDNTFPFYTVSGVSRFYWGSTTKYYVIRPGDGYGDGATSPHGVIVFGEDSTFRRTDYTMTTIHAIQYIDEFQSVSNDTGIYLIVGGTYTNPASSTTNVTVSAVALGIYAYSISTTPTTDKTWLLFKDVLASPVVLQPGDSIHVRYIISFP